MPSKWKVRWTKRRWLDLTLPLLVSRWPHRLPRQSTPSLLPLSSESEPPKYFVSPLLTDWTLQLPEFLMICETRCLNLQEIPTNQITTKLQHTKQEHNSNIRQDITSDIQPNLKSILIDWPTILHLPTKCRYFPVSPVQLYVALRANYTKPQYRRQTQLGAGGKEEHLEWMRVSLQ